MKEQVLNYKQPLSSQQPKKVVFIEMFRAGPQISSTGQKMMFTEDDLDQVVSTYNPETHEAPLIIGHDQDDGTPALGWVRKIWRKGQELWGKVELTPKAEQLIRDGVFKKVSSSFYLPDAETNPTPGSLALRHLGLVSIPAVKGLTAFSEVSEQQTITFAPSEGESSISFKENLGQKQTMARKKTKTETPASVIEHSEGGMTVNINIGGGGSSSPNVYDDSGNKVSETGAPADYEMEYGMDAGMDPMAADSYADPDSDPEAPSDDMSGDDASDPTDDDSVGDDMTGDDGTDDSDPSASGSDMPPSDDASGDAPDASGGPDDAGDSAQPSMETDDVSGDMEGDDQKIAELASNYEIEELIKALALKTDAASMMEGEGDMSYGEMPEGLKKAIEAKRDGNDDSEKEEDDEDKTDMGETVKEGEKPSEAEHPTSEEVKGAEEPKGEQTYSEDEEQETEVSDNGEKCDSCEMEEKEDDEEEKKKADMTEDTTKEVATGTLDHSEKAMGVQSDLQARVAELEEELARQKKMIREKEISDFCETLYEGGKLTQQIVPKTDLVRFMETLNNKNSVNFSETGKASQFDFFKNVLEKLPSMVSFEEFATPASAPAAKKPLRPSADGYVYDPNTASLHAQALEYAETKGVEYTVALKAIISENS